MTVSLELDAFDALMVAAELHSACSGRSGTQATRVRSIADQLFADAIGASRATTEVNMAELTGDEILARDCGRSKRTVTALAGARDRISGLSAPATGRTHQAYLEAPYDAEGDRAMSEEFARRHGFASIEEYDDMRAEEAAERAAELRAELDAEEAERYDDYDRSSDDGPDSDQVADSDSFVEHYADEVA